MMSPRSVGRRLLALLALGTLVPVLLIAPVIQAFGNGQAASLVLGQPTFAGGGYASASRMTYPSDVAADPATGKLFVADTSNSRVLRFASQAALLNNAPAEGVLGQPDFTSRAWVTTARGMDGPVGVALDRDGRLWVADSGNNRVLRFDNAASKPNGAPADGVLGQPDFTSSARAAGAQGMSEPQGVAVDGEGRLWVADTSNSRVLRFDNAASKPNGAPADGVLGQSSFAGSTGAGGAKGMNWPSAVEVDGKGRLWVADRYNNRVLRFDNAAAKPSGAPANGVLGQPTFIDNTGAISPQGMVEPAGLAVDGSGRLWVADRENNRVLRFDSAAAKPNGAAADGVLGQLDFVSTLGGTTATELFSPTGLSVDSSGRLWVADRYNNRVLRFDSAAAKPNGSPADGVLGSNTFTASRPVTADVLETPEGVAVDPTTGKVFVADTWNNRVLRFASRASLSNGAAAEAVLGQPGFTSYTGATTAQGMTLPAGLAVDSGGRLWVADEANMRVLRFDNAASKPNGAAADGVLGQPDFVSRTEATSAEGMFRPSGVAVDTGGRLWVADTSNSRVLRFDSATAKPNGAPADGVLGQADFTSRAIVTSAEKMWAPGGVAVDSSGRLWVADRGNNRVLRFDNAASKPNGAPADGVLGQSDFTSRTGAAGARGMNWPFDVAVDGSGRLWVVEYFNNRALWFDAAAGKPNGAAADGVLGQPDFNSTAEATSARGLKEPRGLTVAPGGGVWIADGANNRVLLFEESTPTTSTPTPSPTSPPTATPTATPAPTGPAGLTRTGGKPDHSRCQEAPGQVYVSGVVAMPTGYQTATLQLNWYVSSPADKRTAPVYQTQTVQEGAQVNFAVPWPGIAPGDTLVHVYIGSVLLDPRTRGPIPGTARRFSEYWYPWVCPAPTPAP